MKNQAKCGSCWSFSTTGSIEGAWKIAGHDLVSLSEQQLVDCAGGKYGNKGCQGGSMDEAMKYVKDNGGLDLESDYQYEAANGKCNLEKEGQHHAFITGHTDVPQNNEAQLEAAVTKGPVSVAIEADKPVFQHVSSHTSAFRFIWPVVLTGHCDDFGTVQRRRPELCPVRYQAGPRRSHRRLRHGLYVFVGLLDCQELMG